VNTTANDHSPAIERKQKARAALQRLKGERQTIETRQRTAASDIERLNQEIVQAERSGEGNTLRVLRDDRREIKESIEDLERALSGLTREIELAEGELIMANRAVQAEQYNQLQTRQAQHLKTIADAVDLIVSTITDKEKVAIRQHAILASVCPGADRRPDAIRHDLAHAIVSRLQGNPPTALRTIDWSSWPMTEQGDLLREVR